MTAINQNQRNTNRTPPPTPPSNHIATARTVAATKHAQEVIHQEEQGDFFRTARSGVNTKLADVRAHDHGKQELAHKIVHHAQVLKDSNLLNEEAVQAEHQIEHIHEHRALLGGFYR